MTPVRIKTSVALTAFLLATPVVAADLGPRGYTKAPPVPYGMPFSWAGFYIGGHAGYGFSNENDVITEGQVAANVLNVTGGARPASVSLKPDGFVGGGQFGYNWQTGPIVFGFETDISYTAIEDERTFVTTALNGVNRLNNTFRQDLEFLGTVRGRIGFAFDRTMAYVTGGFAYGGINNSADLFGPAGNLQFTGNTKRTETGYTVGGGFEHAFAYNWSLKAEYLYYDLGDNTVNVAVIPGSGGGGTGYNSRFHNEGHIVRAGLNYRFGGPVMAGY